MGYNRATRGKLLAGGLVINGAEITEAELEMLDGITAGTVAASKAVVVDANKDASAFRTVVVTNLDAGASGTAGSVDVFPSTASKGKLALAATDNTGDTTTTITNAAAGGARTFTIPDPGASASFDMSAVAAAAADGAISIKSGLVAITKATAAALTLADPTATTDDGKVLRIVSTTAAAHTVSNAAGSGFNNGGAASDVGTFGTAIGNQLTVVAYQGKWYVAGNTGVTLA